MTRLLRDLGALLLLLFGAIAGAILAPIAVYALMAILGVAQSLCWGPTEFGRQLLPGGDPRRPLRLHVPVMDTRRFRRLLPRPAMGESAPPRQVRGRPPGST